MGQDKASLRVEGVPLALRIARELATACRSVTVIGREPLPKCAFLLDREEFGGPLVALSPFRPAKPLVFVAACDMPRFHEGVVRELWTQLGTADAAMPLVDGRRQPLCAVYRAATFSPLRELSAAGERRLMAWVDRLQVIEVSLEFPDQARSANTPEELARLIGSANG